MDVFVFTLGLLAGVGLGFFLRGKLADHNKKQYFYRRVYNTHRSNKPCMGFSAVLSLRHEQQKNYPNAGQAGRGYHPAYS